MKHKTIILLGSVALCATMVCTASCDVNEPNPDTTPEQPVVNDTINNGGNDDNGVVSGSENGHDYVDLGLSVKWATCNVGATTETAYGDYYAWGETETKNEYNDETSLWYGKIVPKLTSAGVIYASGNLKPAYDVARVKWGGKWRMPTQNEMKELLDKCRWTWTSKDGVNGYLVTSNASGNTNSIFLPAAGYRDDSELYYAGEYGDYWSSTVYDGSYYACYLRFYSDIYGWSYNYRYDGRSVRPVSE